MMVHTTSIFAIPLFLTLYVVDTYLLLAATRLLLGRVTLTNKSFLALRQLTDGLPRRIDGWIARQRLKSNPSWLGWAIVMLGGTVIRTLLLAIVVLIP